MTDKPTHQELESQIAQLKEEAEQLRRSQARLEAVLDGLAAAVYVADVETEEILLANRALRAIYGEVVGHHRLEVMGRDATPMTGDATDGPPLSEWFDDEHGLWFEVQEQLVPWADGGSARLVVAVDVTERRRAQELLLQSERLVSIGGLAAGMAHEINNPLAGIIQNIQVLRLRLDPEKPTNLRHARASGTSLDEIAAYFEQRGLFRVMNAIIASGERAARVVDNMLSFAHRSDESFQAYDIAKLLDHAVDVAQRDEEIATRHDFGSIDIVREYAPGVPQVICSGSKMQQVFLDVLVNAARAMHDDPDRATKGPPRLVLRVRADSKLATVEIEDNGRGMSEATCKRVFDPFFSGTSPNGGTGLGLSISYFIVTESHGGEMSVESELGRGTKLIIKLLLMSALLQ